MHLIDHEGFEFVRDHVTPALGCDTALKVIFGSGHNTEWRNARKALLSYFNELDSKTKGLLTPHPVIRR